VRYNRRRNRGRGIDHERTSHIATKRPGTEQQTSRRCNFIQIKRRQDSPPHQLQIQVNCLVRQPIQDNAISISVSAINQRLNQVDNPPRWIHHRSQISNPGPKFPLHVLLPPDRTRLRFDIPSCGTGAQNTNSTLPCSCARWELGITPR
jgi:hypothetical protein